MRVKKENKENENTMIHYVTNTMKTFVLMSVASRNPPEGSGA